MLAHTFKLDYKPSPSASLCKDESLVASHNLLLSAISDTILNITIITMWKYLIDFICDIVDPILYCDILMFADHSSNYLQVTMKVRQKIALMKTRKQLEETRLLSTLS